MAIGERWLQGGGRKLAEFRMQRELQPNLVQEANGENGHRTEVPSLPSVNGGSRGYPIEVDANTGIVSAPTAPDAVAANVQDYADHYEWGVAISPETVKKKCFSSDARAKYKEAYPDLTELEIDQVLATVQGRVDTAVVFSYFPIMTHRALKELQERKLGKNGVGH